MTEPAHNSGSSPNDAAERPAGVEPAQSTDPAQVSAELFTHGLLVFLHMDDPRTQNRRVEDVMHRIADDESGAAEVRTRRLVFPMRLVRSVAAMAACLAIFGAIAFIAFPGASSASAVVQQSISAMRAGGDRRYEVRVQEFDDSEFSIDPIGIVDTRSPNLLVIRNLTPQGQVIVVGRDSTGDWAIRPDSTVERRNPRIAWPRWATVGEDSLFADSIDRVMEQMTRQYTIETGAEDKSGKLAGFTHVVGRKKLGTGPGPNRMELWIDPATKVVEKIELSWDQPPLGGATRHPGLQGTPGQGPSGDRPGREHGPGIGPDRDADPEGRPERRARPEDGPLGGPRPDDGPGDELERPFPPRHHPQGRPPHEREHIDDDAPPRDGPFARRPDRGPDGPDAGRPRGPRGMPPHERFDGFTRDRLPPHPPRQDPLSRQGPPRTLIMQRVDSPALESSWFTPEAHISATP